MRQSITGYNPVHNSNGHRPRSPRLTAFNGRLQIVLLDSSEVFFFFMKRGCAIHEVVKELLENDSDVDSLNFV